MEMKLRHVLELWAYYVGSALIRSLPVSLVQRLTAATARAVFDRGGKRARYTLVNLRIAFPELSEEERYRIGRESFVHFTWNMVDLMRSEKWSEDQIRQRFSMSGVETFHDAVAQGNGVLLLTLHLGNFELGALAAPLWGMDVTWVARPIGNKLLYERVSAQRTRTGGKIIGKRGVASTILKELQEGKAVGILNDQYAKRSRGVLVPFFGARCSTTAGAAAVVLRAGASVVPAYMVRDGPDHHAANFLPPMKIQVTGNKEHDVAALTADINRAYEEMIRRHPEQYWWHTRRYRHSPDLPEDLYD
jgi:KDO2-lipid IV(A) lauroyltransferase